GERFSEAYAAIQGYAGKDKIIGITECGSVPDTDTAFRDKAVWSFFGLMGGEYVSDSKGEYSEQYTSKDALIKAYNSEGTLTLDEIEE
ncbi:MAG: glycoside hydrolase, partial [Ruminococcus sp.]|nr:glycoside hydrolase [Ruminococcus sp.]